MNATALRSQVRFGDGETVRVASLLRRNIFYEGEVMKLVEILVKAYEPHKMPATYMADCVVMANAVLRQLEQYGGNLVPYQEGAMHQEGSPSRTGTSWCL